MFGQAIGKGFLPDVHCPTGAPREVDREDHQGRAGRHRRQGTLAAGRARASGPATRSRRDEDVPRRRLRRAATEGGSVTMARVYNWQLGREMSYWYPESRPQAAVRGGLRHQQVHRVPDLHARLQDHLDVGQGPGVHALEQRRDQALRLLSAGLGPEAAREARRAEVERRGATTGRRSSRRRRPASACSAGGPRSIDYAYPNVGEDDCAGSDRQRRRASRCRT